MKTSKAVRKRDKILQAAASVVAQRGYADATLAEIGEVAGTFAGSLYYYFPSKDALVEEVLNIGTTSVSAPVMEAVAALPNDASAWRKIKTALDEHVERILSKNDFITAYWKIIDQVPEAMSGRHREHPRKYGGFWRDLIREGQAEGIIRSDLEPNLVQLFLLGATIYGQVWYNPAGALKPRQLSDQLARMFFRGISPPDADLTFDKAAAASPDTARVAAAGKASKPRRASNARAV
ncbi:TetR/AcrR family transcriptional regulator [Sphingobium sp. AN641]|uniref:TetR/AcrR family transcriptional regulator n=1 Tax=Sphingobium sp. AN641 TaxID=3133443 RepID=UPI0030BE5230